MHDSLQLPSIVIIEHMDICIEASGASQSECDIRNRDSSNNKWSISKNTGQIEGFVYSEEIRPPTRSTAKLSIGNSIKADSSFDGKKFESYISCWLANV